MLNAPSTSSLMKVIVYGLDLEQLMVEFGN